MARNVLALATLTDRSTITIDGQAYDLINPEELSIVDTHRVGKWGSRVQELYKDIDSRPEADIAELAELLDKLCRMLWRAPGEVHDRLTDNQRLSIAMAFTGLQRGTVPVAAGANEEPVKAVLEMVGVDPFGTSTGANP